MSMKRLFLSFLFLLSLMNHASAQTVIDTLQSPYGPILLYSDNRWVYLKDKQFDGVMNEKIHQLLTLDSNYRFTHPWNTETCYPSGGRNDFSKLKDTLWLCVEGDSMQNFYAPVPGIVTSKYGYRNGRHHSGIDLDLETGDTVRSCWSGKIRYSKYNTGVFGNLVIVRHHNGLETFYVHLSKLLVRPNEDVEAGQPIGLGGNTGRSYGSHLHFEVRLYDEAINPEEVIDFKEMEAKSENFMVHKGIFRPGAKPTDWMEQHSETDHVVAAVPQPKKVYYRVKSGDTLSRIASINRTTISKLCQLNGIKPSTMLQIGRSLRIK